jgi:hypothetical protein
MTSLLIDNFLVDQLTTVVSIISNWISPELLHIFDRKLFVAILDG